MSDPPRIGGVAPVALVRGGTTSGAHDRQRAEAEHTARQGRAHADRQERLANAGLRIDQKGITSAKIHSLNMMDRGSPKLVLYYMNADKTVRQECISELFMTDTDSGFTMVCPRCLERGEPHGQSQIKVMNSHRKFHLDNRKAGTFVQLHDPDGNPVHVRLCGTVTCDDIIKCDSCGLWQVRVVDSRVWEV